MLQINAESRGSSPDIFSFNAEETLVDNAVGRLSIS